MTNTTVTPYNAAKLANLRLVEVGLKKIPSQMMYNYTTQKLNQGKSPLIETVVVDGQVHVVVEDLERWITSYITKKQAKSTPTNPYSQPAMSA